jgi:hypothetical protein
VKYWAFFAAKFAVAGAVGWSLVHLAMGVVSAPGPLRSFKPRYGFGFDLGFTFLVLLFWLFAAGVIWAIVWDQRFRCRTCLRRLRMPVQKGNWTHVLLGGPSTEYICLYGHGTLKVDELCLTGHHAPDWEQHEDIWKELFSETKH